ncbi:hypothetical protein J5N97_028189 [Dioscorea zingiberensis]|uniref:Uncharacterized protein n=1 Tax=Dioscorea zingiberensis TaxID=325984 RepID=A0A9D5BY23_9LILI|nr:hypothetical protein J5N97_028189 [Dioscorea zingiberensis]
MSRVYLVKGKKALADSRACINVMPYKLYIKLGLEAQKPTGITLQLADRFVMRPIGFTEDVLVQINQFVFPTYSILLNVDDDVDVPIILGHPFLATAQALDDTSYSVDEIDIITSECIENLMMMGLVMHSGSRYTLVGQGSDSCDDQESDFEDSDPP